MWLDSESCAWETIKSANPRPDREGGRATKGVCVCRGGGGGQNIAGIVKNHYQPVDKMDKRSSRMEPFSGVAISKLRLNYWQTSVRPLSETTPNWVFSDPSLPQSLQSIIHRPYKLRCSRLAPFDLQLFRSQKQTTPPLPQYNNPQTDRQTEVKTAVNNATCPEHA